MIKRILVFLIGAVMAFAMVPGMSFAADTDGYNDMPNKQRSRDANQVRVDYNKDADYISSNKFGYFERIHLEPGVYEFKMWTGSLDEGKTASAYGGLFTDDRTFDEPLNGEGRFAYDTSESKTYGSVVYKVTSAGKYYLGAYSKMSIEADNVRVWFSLNNLKKINLNAVMEFGTDYGIWYAQDAENVRRYKIEPNVTGELRFIMSRPGEIKIYDANGNKLLSKSTTGKEKYKYFGVTGGKTYRISIINNSDYPQRGFWIRQKLIMKTQLAGKSKKKARELNKGKYYLAFRYAGLEDARWFKLKTTKKSRLKFSYEGHVSDRIVLKILKSDGKKLIKNGVRNITVKNPDGSFTTEKLKKGTYYVKVIRGTKYTSGWCKVKWNYK
ncbi:MAG: hypothetical protein IKS63_04320 [Firmicutes bacterium]|nr:hypothetical protein [Bacillota bacterium]